MKFSCYKQDLIEAVQFVSKAVAVKSTTPILSGIYIKAAGSGQIELQANNLNTGIIATVCANVEEQGVAVVSGKRFGEFIRNLPDDTVTLALEDNLLTLKSGGANVELLTMNAEDFPVVEQLSGEITFEISMDKLANLINKTAFATAKEIERPIFTAVNFAIDGTGITGIGTNTHRLAMIKDTLDEPCAACKFNVLGETLRNLVAKLDSKETDKKIKIIKSDRAVAFSFDNNFLTARLIEGTCPPYEKAIPQTSTTHVMVETAEFRRVINFISLMSKETEYNTVKFDISGSGFEIAANSDNIGNATQSVENVMDGDRLRIAFNIEYISDFLRVYDGQKLKLDFNDKFSPAKLTNPDDPNYIYIVMPVRT